MFRQFQVKRSIRASVTSLGFCASLLFMPNLASAGGEMTLPDGQTPPAEDQKPSTDTKPGGSGMGMNPHDMEGGGMGMKPKMNEKGMGMMGRGSEMQGKGRGMMGKGMEMGKQGQGMGKMGMGMMGEGSEMQGKGMGMGMMGKGMEMGKQGQGMGKMGMGMMGNNPDSNQPSNAAETTANPADHSATKNLGSSTELYHSGSVDFFLDQSEQLQLTDKQKAELERIKQRSAENSGRLQIKIDDAEKSLFQLTGVPSPNESQIANKLKSIEKLKGEQRLGFIQSVGQAVKVLDTNQRKMHLAH